MSFKSPTAIAHRKATILSIIRQKPGISTLEVRRAVNATLPGEISIIGMHFELENLEADGDVASQEESGGPERGGRPSRHWHLTKPID